MGASGNSAQRSRALIYILDTDVISALRRPDRSPQVAAWLRGRSHDSLYLSVVTLGEIERGIVKQAAHAPDFAADLKSWLDRTILLFGDRLLPFGAQEARMWGRLSEKLGHAGADLQIAATALTHDATVVTRNVAHFKPTGVTLINPFD